MGARKTKVPSCLPNFGTQKQSSESINCIIPDHSIVVKEGELMKIGNKTGTMQTRFYILRDQALFIYNNRQQKVPSNIISLRGLYINQIKPDKSIECYGFCISHEQKDVKTRIFYHRNQEAILDWIKCLKQEGNNQSFDDKYVRGRKLGKGKFSTVF